MKKAIIIFWNKVPAIIRAILIGILIQVIGVMPLILLISKNIEIQANIPWALIVGLVYIWIFWKFVSGNKGPFSSSPSRKNLSRLNRMEPNVRKWAYISGVPFSITLITFSFLGYFLTEVPINQVQLLTSLKSIPIWTSISLIFLGAFITGFVEETAFRGYMQRIIEEKHTPLLAILIVAFVFTIVHFLPMPVWPLFILGSIGWGYLAYYSNSIIPGIIFHSIIDFVGFLWGMQNIEQLKEIFEYNIFIDGVNNSFVMLALIAFTFALFTVLSFYRLKKEMALTMAKKSYVSYGRPSF